MADPNVVGYRSQVAALEARLGGHEAQAELDARKTEIGALFKNIDQELSDLTTLRDDVKRLVDRWKALKAQQPGGGAADRPSNAPQFTADKPVVHADHIGASTFLEKGWSKLSLGDHAGAEAALRRADELSPNAPQTEALLGWALMLQEKYDDALTM